MKVVHLTSAHQRYDTRIFIKQCSSLANNGYDVSLVVADGKGDETVSNVNIVDVGAKRGGRLSRMTKTVKLVLRKALELDADIYHLHDPELLTVYWFLKNKGKKVVFDAHEDLPIQILSKPYLSPIFARLISKVVNHVESFLCHRVDAVVAATPFIRDKFLKINSISVDINNYPKIDEFISIDMSNFLERTSCCYIGGITEVRGIYEMVQAIGLNRSDITLKLAGGFSEENVKDKVCQFDGWRKVQELGWIDRAAIARVLSESFAGLVTLHPIQNYQDALPVKMFEYMAAGVPVIASNIPLWESIINEEKCGVCVNPYSEKEISDALDLLNASLEDAKEMGLRGRAAVIEKYNWAIEEQKLFNLYQKLLNA